MILLLPIPIQLKINYFFRLNAGVFISTILFYFLTGWDTQELAPTLGVAESRDCSGKLVVVDTVVDLLEDASDPLLLLDELLKLSFRQFDAHLFQLELDTVAVC